MNRIGSLILAGLTLAALSATAFAANPVFRYTVNSQVSLNSSAPSASVDAVVDEPVSISGASLISAPVGATWSVSSGSLPPGLQLDSTSGVIAGSPDASGTWSVQLTATGTSSSASVDLTISVTQSQTQTPQTTISLAAAAQLSGTVGDDFSYDFTPLASFTNGAPTLAWSSTDLSVPGLSIGPSNGILSGKPTAAGTYGFTLTAQASNDPSVVPGQQTYSIKIDTPAGPVILTGVVQMVQLTSNACVLQTGGVVKCWGSNSRGTLGDGTNTANYIPTQIHAIDGATAISGAGDSMCAIVGGAAKCWGRGLEGQLGTGDTSDRLVPTTVTGLSSGVTKVAEGERHGCAVKGTGVSCWGNGGNGQLGNSQFVGMSSTPVSVVSLPSGTILDLKVGYTSSCITVSSSTFMYCWGRAAEGDTSLGAGHADASIPTAASGTSGTVSKIGLGEYFGCGMVASSGYAYCWGKGTSGQLGTSGLTGSYTAHRVFGVYEVTDIAVGYAHACALAHGGVWCWGAALGAGQASNAAVPVQISGLSSGVSAIFAGANQTCAVMSSGGTKCFGANNAHQLSDTTTTNRSTPVDAYDAP